MNIEQLTKSQIILLTLLISFVTSIATGIVTVSLIDQAPQSVTRTINKVVERTVERVLPSEPEKSSVATVISSPVTTTVVVKEDDLVTEAIAANKDKVVRIYTRTPSTSLVATASTSDKTGDVFKGYGVVARANGVIATSDTIVIPGKSYVIKFSDNTEYNAKPLVEGKSPIGLLGIVSDKDAVLPPFSPVTFGTTGTLKLGQTVILLSGEEQMRISIGAIAELVRESTKVATTDSTGKPITEAPQKLIGIQTTMALAPPQGAALINPYKEVLALGSIDSYIPVTSDAIEALLGSIVATTSPKKAE